MTTPAAPDTTRDRYSLVDTRNGNTTKRPNSTPKGGYGFYDLVINLYLGHSDELVRDLDKSHEKRGRHGFPSRAKLAISLLQFLLNERYNNHHLNRLSASPQLLEICGLEEVPDEGTYSRFKKKLVEYPEQLAEIQDLTLRDLAREIRRLKKAGVIPKKAPRLGEYLAIDATDIESWAKYRAPHCNHPDKENCTEKHRKHCNDPDRAKCSIHSGKPIADPSAMWGHRTPKGKLGTRRVRDGEDDGEFFFGHKAYVISDAVYGIPLHIVLRPANENETIHFAQDLDDTLERHPWLKPKFLLADKGYDSEDNFAHTLKQDMTPVIAVRQPPKNKKTGKRLFDGTYTEDGRPVCVGGEPMAWLGTDPSGAHHFRCPARGCKLRDKIDWSRYCDSEHSEKPEGRLLRTIGIIPRFSKLWRKIYNKRGSIERWFGSAKRSRLLDKHQLLRMGKISLHVNMSMLAWLLTALARLKADDYKRMRYMYIRLPRAKRGTRREAAELNLAEVHECEGCHLCPQHYRLAA